MAIREIEATQDVQTDGEAPSMEAPADSNHDADTLAKIVELNCDVSVARVAYDRADRARKAAKEELEERQAALNEFIGGLTEDYPLFDRKPDGEVPADTDDSASLSWRSVHIEKLADFGLPEPMVGILIEAGITSVGAVADWTTAKPLTDIAGVGAAKAEKIADALESFWRDRGNAEVLAGVKEAEAGPAGWRYAVVGDIGLAEKTVELLDEHVISTVGELVAITRGGASWLGVAALRDVNNALEAYRGWLTTEQIADFDAVRRGEEGAASGDESESAPAPKAARPGRTRKAKVSA